VPVDSPEDTHRSVFRSSSSPTGYYRIGAAPA
jgi:hypothetical protein